MSVKLKQAKAPKNEQPLAVLLKEVKDAAAYCRNESEQHFVEKKIKEKAGLIAVNQYERMLFFVAPPEDKEGYWLREFYRKKGFELAQIIRSEKLESLQLCTTSEEAQPLLDMSEGLLLASYSFDKYKSDKKAQQSVFKALVIAHEHLKKKAVEELENLVEGTFYARDLVNEPAVSLNAEQLGKSLKKLGKEADFKVDVLGKDKIKALKMGGLLAVNTGSIDPPTFNVLEYKPDNAVNKQPYVLVGKGVTYDTGGLSLKPSDSMVGMKADMGGAAAVAGAFLAVVKNKLPIYLVGLIPSTDNRPGGNAITPGDVITISDGSTVEVLNTDAEGRLILADALVYAKKYKPELVIDLATLTGAAVAAIGKEGCVMMGTASEESRKQLKEAGNETYERLVEFPLWEEYRDYLKSDIADLKNIGGRTAGAITAGMFLKHFTDYPWIHLDIAGTAYLDTPDYYKGKNGTGAGVRLLYQFLKTLVKK
ncbi:leucyl aminopeptidase family protein [Catalinimonas niigatensis]|uniref:leucyl aminopeptidase family protein n=1 Tax=Catalinimonas niigatensis TaxID=1397264 RepID=UPI002666BE3D|nr:leucyl aminopeptidase [Catalinimonas niigatensis]WPP52862.1 leucyl aminopeptidase [Catalinimonas niigatensis]